MTPKEKADDIVDKFLDYANADIDKKHKEFSVSLRENAKQCALVCVDELSAECTQLAQYFVKTFQPEQARTILKNQVKYWSEVKTELEKL